MNLAFVPQSSNGSRNFKKKGLLHRKHKELMEVELKVAGINLVNLMNNLVCGILEGALHSLSWKSLSRLNNSNVRTEQINSDSPWLHTRGR